MVNIFEENMVKMWSWTDKCYSPHEIGVHHDMQRQDPENLKHTETTQDENLYWPWNKLGSSNLSSIYRLAH